MSEDVCRCGHVGKTEPHPCHGNGYTCRKPASFRIYNAHPVPLSGMQMKLGADATWACDDCWKEHQAKIDAAAKK